MSAPCDDERIDPYDPADRCPRYGDPDHLSPECDACNGLEPDWIHPEPATPFWEGYRRPPQMVEELVTAFAAALQANPTQRAGQLINNAIHRADLARIYDENLLARLKDAAG